MARPTSSDFNLASASAVRSVISIEPDHAASALDEIAGDRTAHDASPIIPTVFTMRVVSMSCRIRLTGNDRRALTADQTPDNQEAASSGQAASVATRHN
jgi:hypothetical protein